MDISFSPIINTSNKDKVFLTPPYPRKFSFSREVADVFDDMILRSIPMYREVIDSLSEWALKFYQEGTNIIDLGCSTGTAIAAISNRALKPMSFIGIDSSFPMIKKAQEKLNVFSNFHTIKLYHKDICEVDFKDTSVVILNYTLQFIPISKRKELLTKIYQCLPHKGMLFISEKVLSSNIIFQELIDDLYIKFKEQNGYSKNEIERKKEALDNVLIPLTFNDQISLIRSAGFKNIEPLIKWNNFLSLVALKI